MSFEEELGLAADESNAIDELFLRVQLLLAVRLKEKYDWVDWR